MRITELFRSCPLAIFYRGQSPYIIVFRYTAELIDCCVVPLILAHRRRTSVYEHGLVHMSASSCGCAQDIIVNITLFGKCRGKTKKAPGAFMQFRTTKHTVHYVIAALKSINTIDQKATQSSGRAIVTFSASVLLVRIQFSGSSISWTSSITAEGNMVRHSCAWTSPVQHHRQLC